MNNLTIFKLISGEELVAEQVEPSDGTIIKIKNAVTLVYQQVGEGKMSVGFAPFMPYAEDQIDLRVSAIASMSKPKDQIAQEHMRVFSGILIAPANAKLA